MPFPRPRATVPGLAAVVLLAACTDRTPTASVPLPPVGDLVRVELTCTVSLDDPGMRCTEPGPEGPAADLILGGQGQYVRLESTNPSMMDSVFSVDVTIQNLVDQPMGSADGTTATGIRVFFAQEPVATEGSGSVRIQNASGTGTFTSARQPYFEYPEILPPRGRSAPLTWRFVAPATVARFSFTVLVHTALPAEDAPLHWVHEAGSHADTAMTDLLDVLAFSPTNVFAVGRRGGVMHFDGTRWTSLGGASDRNLLAISGDGPTNVWAAGSSGTITHFDGTAWRRMMYWPTQLMVRITFSGIWARGDTIMAVGRGGPSLTIDQESPGSAYIVRSSDRGASWQVTEMLWPSTTRWRYLYDVRRMPSGAFLVVGDEENTHGGGDARGLVMRSVDGGATWTETLHPEDALRYNDLWVSQGGRAYVTGSWKDPDSGRLRTIFRESADGETWAAPQYLTETSADMLGEGIWGEENGDLIIVGNRGLRLRRSGGDWTNESSPGGESFTAVAGLPGGDTWAVSYEGTVTRYGPDGWEEVVASRHLGPSYTSVGGSRANNVLVTGRRPGAGGLDASFVQRWNGAAWDTVLPARDSTDLLDVWVRNASAAYVVGRARIPGEEANRGVILRWNGSTWTDIAPDGGGRDREYTAVWGMGSTLYVAGRQTVAPGEMATLILRSTNSGGSWTDTRLASTAGYAGYLADIAGSGPDELYAVGREERPGTEQTLFFRFDGTQWTRMPTRSDTRRLTGVWVSASPGGGDTVVCLVGVIGSMQSTRGVILESRDDGQTFTRTTRQVGQAYGSTLEAIWGTSPTMMFTGGFNGGVFQRSVSGWADVGPHHVPIIRGIWGSSSRDVWVVGDQGLILHGTR